MIVVVVVVVVFLVGVVIAIESSKSGSNPSVLNTFDLEMCLAPQRRALFRRRMTIESLKSGPSTW